jgi:hypothetical protein
LPTTKCPRESSSHRNCRRARQASASALVEINACEGCS